MKSLVSSLVSCICITQNRQLFLRQAIHYFLRARLYCKLECECELIIVDGSEKPSKILIDTITLRAKNIQYFHLPSEPHTKTGWFHNQAVERARGNIIITWDDDDWHAPDRILKQVQKLEAYTPNKYYEGALALTSQYYGYHLADRQAFRSRCWGNGLGSLGSAFAFHRSVWEKVPFRDVDQAEDQGFLEDCQKSDIPIVDMKNPSYFVYMRHNQNGSAHSNNTYESDTTLKVQELIKGDIDFYDELSEILPLSQWNHPTTFGQYGLYNRNLQPR